MPTRLSQNTARSDYGMRLRIREGFVHRDKTIVALACDSSFWNRDFKTISQKQQNEEKVAPKKRIRYTVYCDILWTTILRKGHPADSEVYRIHLNQAGVCLSEAR